MTDVFYKHSKQINKIQATLIEHFNNRTHVKIYHGSTNSTRFIHFEKDKMIDVSLLNHIIEINTVQQYTIVEPNVPLDRLIVETLKYGLMPAVVSEFPGITIGGAVQGGAGESSSFKYGCLHETCLEYEIVIANGDILKVSAAENVDLYYGSPCTYGTLGVLTLIKFQLVPATKYVRLDYFKINSYGEALATITGKAKQSIDFIDGIMFGKKLGVIMIGSLSDSNPAKLKISHFHRSRDEWFYLHAQHIIAKYDYYSELIPMKDYLFRYDRGAFWLGKHGFDILHLPFNRLFRYCLADLMKTRRLLRFLHGSNMSQQFLVQDVCLPSHNVTAFLKFVDQQYGIYPLWLCPLKPDTQYQFAPNYITTDLVINVGIWDKLAVGINSFVIKNQQLEQAIANFSGRKVLYAHTYYTNSQFWEYYDKKSYNKLRANYRANFVFPDIYNKVFVNQKPQPSLMGGWLAFIKSPF